MNIPYEMQEATEKLLEKRSILNIRNCVSSICERYNNGSGHGKVLVKNEEEAVSYAISRMPGTYGAMKSAIRAFRENCDTEFRTLTDIGSGTGAAVWAVASEYDLSRITCFERESSMAAVGKHMLSYGDEAMRNAAWVQGDATNGKTQTSELVTAGYIMNELRPEDRESFLDLLWNTAEKAVILIEPGTCEGYRNILLARKYFIEKGAKVVAPCTHMHDCPLPDNDWCHFSCRMQRSKVQRYVKGGDAPYEDEKFSYIAINKMEPRDGVKDPFSEAVQESSSSRIIRHPITNKGFIELKTCSERGIEELKITSRDKERFKAARKAEWGESF